MKILLYSVLMFCGISKTFSQQTNYFSAEIDMNYYNYFLGNINTEDFNYGSSILISEYSQKLKLSLGINYSTKSFSYKVSPDINDGYLYKREYNIAYLNFPFITTFEIFSRKSFSSSLYTGFLFHKNIDFDIISYYLYKQPFIENNIKEDKMGLSLVLGSTFSKLFKSQYKLNISPNINYKIVSDYGYHKPEYRNLPDDHLFWGLKIGLEYLFIK